MWVRSELTLSRNEPKEHKLEPDKGTSHLWRHNDKYIHRRQRAVQATSYESNEVVEWQDIAPDLHQVLLMICKQQQLLQQHEQHSKQQQNITHDSILCWHMAINRSCNFVKVTLAELFVMELDNKELLFINKGRRKDTISSSFRWEHAKRTTKKICKLKQNKQTCR